MDLTLTLTLTPMPRYAALFAYLDRCLPVSSA